MGNKEGLTRILAVVGTVLSWFPIAAPLLLSLIVFPQRGVFLLDFLMPAELFPVALVGGGLLLWAALRKHSHVKIIAGGLGAAIVMLLGGQALAVITGLASGEIEPAGIWFVVVLMSLAIYTLALIAVGVGGILLLRDLFGPPRLAPHNL